MGTVEGQIERIGRFEIIRKLASGGMGSVCLACLSGEAGFRRLVALKRLHPHLADEPDFVHMFFDEARLAARIHHPNVVPILEIGREGNERFLVMEYVEGITAENFRGLPTPLPPPIATRVVLDALSGLHAAHDLEDDTGASLDLVHRDVSPQNILVGKDGLARLTDFGIARAAARISRSTLAGTFKGKLCYAAPEQLLGRPIDRRTDLYAMGIVLWELLTGERLFDADTEAAVYDKLLHRPIPSPDSVRPDLAPELVAVCMKALQRTITSRFTAAAEFEGALETATRTAGLATNREVGAFVTEFAGDKMNERREAVRSWIAKREATGTFTSTIEPPPQVTARVGPSGRPANPAISSSPSNASSPSPLSPSPLESGPTVASDPSRPVAPGMPPPYHWSMRAPLAVPPPEPRATGKWIGAGALIGLVIAIAIGVPFVMRSRAQSANAPPAVTARDAPPPATATDPPTASTSFVASAPGTGVGGAASSSASAPASAPRRPAGGPRPPPPPGGKNADFGDRW